MQPKEKGRTSAQGTATGKVKHSDAIIIREAAPESKSCGLYWMREPNGPWHYIPSTDSALEKAISQGAMFATWIHLSEPIEKNPCPHRWGRLVIDLDNKEDFETVRKHTLQLIKALSAHDVEPDDILIFYSGSKGFHIEIPATVLGSEKGHPLLPLIYKRMLHNLVDGLDINSIDWSIFCMRKGKMFRLPNVKRSNGRHKIPISHTELEKWSEDKIIKTAEKPRELLKPGPGKQAKGLSALYKQALAEIEHEEAKKHESQANVH